MDCYHLEFVERLWRDTVGEQGIEPCLSIKIFEIFYVGEPGFEPGLNPPEGLVLPLHYSP